MSGYAMFRLLSLDRPNPTPSAAALSLPPSARSGSFLLCLHSNLSFVHISNGELMSRCIGIIGSRRRNSNDDYMKCLEAFHEYFQDGDTLVSGGCPKGGDKFAEKIADKYGIPVKSSKDGSYPQKGTLHIHYPNWNTGNLAGLDRNTFIARDADILIAVVASDRHGGTEDTIRKYANMGKTMLVLVE